MDKHDAEKSNTTKIDVSKQNHGHKSELTGMKKSYISIKNMFDFNCNCIYTFCRS